MAGTTQRRIGSAVAWADRTAIRGQRALGSRGVRRAWLVVASLFAAVALGVGVYQVATVLAREDRTEVTEFDARDLDRLTVDNGAGSVTVVGVADAESVRVRARIRDGLRATGHEVERRGAALEVRATCPLFGTQWCAVDYTIEVPADLPIEVSALDGVGVSDVAAGVVASSDTSSVRLARVSGDVTVDADQGRVEGTDLVASRMHANADQGRIELEFDTSPDEIVVDADQGSILIVLPDEPGVAYATDTDADQGSVSDAIRQDPSARRSITADADQGDITITYAAR
ncbi:MAG TPA: DUF4097 family beta strand repeat-containing protein [Acidimicrobiales bacterium]